MKKFIIANCMNYIKKNTNYNEVKLAEIKYGLVSIYLLITKFIIISLMAFTFGIFKEMLIFALIYNIIRMPSFGLHATKSWICLLFSSIAFLGIPFISTIVVLPLHFRIISGVLCILLMIKNAPADTHKKPIVSKKRRRIYKTISSIIATVFVLLSISIKNTFIVNCLIFSLILQCIIISPITYKIFKLPYNNYKNYLKAHPELSN